MYIVLLACKVRVTVGDSGLCCCTCVVFIDKFCIDYHFFADDSELYSCLPTEPESALRALRNVESCCRQIKIWMTKNKLKLNEQKSEVLLCGPSSRRETVPVDCLSVGEASIPFSNVVKTLGVTLDAELSMEQHVSAVIRSRFFHIRSLVKSVHTSPTKLQAALLSV